MDELSGILVIARAAGANATHPPFFAYGLSKLFVERLAPRAGEVGTLIAKAKGRKTDVHGYYRQFAEK